MKRRLHDNIHGKGGMGSKTTWAKKPNPRLRPVGWWAKRNKQNAMKHPEPLSVQVIMLLVAAATALAFAVRWLWRRVARWARRRRKRREFLEMVFAALMFLFIAAFILLLTNQ